MKIIALFLCLPGMAIAKEPNPSAKATARATVQMLGEVQSALNMVSQAASECYGLQVANPSGKSYLLSDSMVNNLSCSNLNPATVFRSLQPTAFSATKHFPVMNWPSNGIANCWALALAQRQAFYLTRFGAKANSPGIARSIQGMAGGDMPGTVVSMAETKMSGNTFTQAQAGGVFRAQIEKRQGEKFYSAGNLGYVFGGRERGEDANRETIQQLLSGVSRGRMPAIILRAALTAQHVVLVKKVQKTGPDSYRFTVYDSNQPMSYFDPDNFREPTIEYTNGQFYAPQVVGRFHSDGQSAVGVFVTDEDEMDKIQGVVFNHYAQLCKKVKALEKAL